MKFINLLALLVAALFFTACASTDESAPAADTDTVDTAESETTNTEVLLMDRYKSGEIPGYRD